MTILPSRLPAVALPPQPDDTPWPVDSWPTGEVPEAFGGQLEELLDLAFPTDGTDPELDLGLSLGFVAIHRGRLVAERYGSTADQDEQLISWSMAKSVTHALAGMLVADGTLDLHRPKVLPEWSGENDQRAAVTVDHMLRMVPGTLFNEDYVDSETSHCIDMLFGSGNPDIPVMSPSSRPSPIRTRCSTTRAGRPCSSAGFWPISSAVEATISRRG